MKRHLFLPALLVFFVAACGAAPVVRDENLLKDTSLISGDPCKAPCWQNIVPGETDWDDALTMLEDNAAYANFQTQEDENSDARAVAWQQGDGPTCCQMFSRNGSVVDTVFVLLAPQVTLGEVIAVYGEPTYLLGEEVTEDQALMSLLYPEIPLVVYAFVAGKEQGVLTETSEIVGAIYLTADDMEEILKTSSFYNWEGYQAFTDYIDGNYDYTPVPTVEGETTPEADE